MKVWIVQRPTKTGWRNIAAYFKKGEARTHCVPNFADRIVEGDCYDKIIAPPGFQTVRGVVKCKRKRGAK